MVKAVPMALLFSQETDGHGPPLHVWGEALAKLSR